MAMTLHAVLQVIDRERPRHAGQLLTRAADAAIDGARGNSGAILAQFLLGLGDRAGPISRRPRGAVRRMRATPSSTRVCASPRRGINSKSCARPTSWTPARKVSSTCSRT
ncbi:MAG: DAK2 domain-containing protein [Gammaproteobacteria bacterium]